MAHRASLDTGVSYAPAQITTTTRGYGWVAWGTLPLGAGKFVFDNDAVVFVPD